jgi:hypothetical protein
MRRWTLPVLKRARSHLILYLYYSCALVIVLQTCIHRKGPGQPVGRDVPGRPATVRLLDRLTQSGSVTTTKALLTLRGQGAKGSHGCHQKV